VGGSETLEEDRLCKEAVEEGAVKVSLWEDTEDEGETLLVVLNIFPRAADVCS
jgi:hypothetical protein